MKIKIISAIFTSLFSLSVLASSDFTCMGTEPFWLLNIVGESMTFSSPMSDEPVVMKVVSRTNAINTQDDFAFVVKSDTASATIITGDCSDGMSDTLYTHHVVYMSDENVMYGCCNKNIN